MVVPFPAGGATTTLARVLAEHLKETLGRRSSWRTWLAQGQHRGCPKRACGARWLLAELRQPGESRRSRRGLSGCIRRLGGL